MFSMVLILDKLITRLNKFFLKNESQKTYLAFAKFEKYPRPAEMSLKIYINNFVRLRNKVLQDLAAWPNQGIEVVEKL